MIDVYPDALNARNTLDTFKRVNKNISKKKEDILFLLSSYSRFLGREITRNPSILDYLVNSKFIKKQKPINELLREACEISANSQDIAQFLSDIKKYKYRVPKYFKVQIYEKYFLMIISKFPF